MIFTFGREYGISEVGKGAVSCSPNFQIPRNLKLDTRTETRARPNSSLENPQIFFEDRVENYWRQLIANIRETMQCERTSKRFLSFSIVQKFSCTRKKKNCTDFTTSRFYSRCTRGVIFPTVTHFTLVPLWCLCINVFIRLFIPLWSLHRIVLFVEFVHLFWI